MEVITVDVTSLGNRAYLVHDGRSALAIDPPRDVTRRSSEQPSWPASTSWRSPTPTSTTTTSRAPCCSLADTVPTTSCRPGSGSDSNASASGPGTT